MLNLVVVLLIFFTSLCWSAGGFADSNCPKESSATLISLQGKALVEIGGKGIPHEVKLNDKICQGDRVSTQPNSRVSLELPGNEILRLKEQTEITFAELNINTASIIKIAKGFLNFISRKPKEIKIESGITNAMPLGTEFAFNVDEAKASVWVYEGKVKVFNQYGSVIIGPGNSFAQVEKGQAPKVQIDIHPQDAVNWALYYPSLLPYPAKSTDTDNDIRLAIEAYRHGQVSAAFARLDTLPPSKQTPYFHKVRGAMRLTVGQDELALDDINTLITINPNDAEALALLSVKALSQNHKEDAYTLANKAIKADPQSVSAYSALSYAEQGRFQLDKALMAAKNATKIAPHDAMIFARQAELELALGLSSDSEQSAQHALALDANLERTQTVMGFRYLTSMDTDEALHSFNQAIQLNSTAPLPRLGLGLAKIRDGDLSEGRKDIEIASLLDPNNSLIRSYLGKAYYEENRNPLAEDQFKLAKERDPKDPTPYFYDALKKQTENRPVEALHELQKSIELNGNRAVLRSKQLLDQDQAIRGTSIARVFNTLGLETRGVIEASKSLMLDPSDYSSHRFLSDSYVNTSRQQIAQVSELLQAQLLQPININPVQPHLSVTGLGSISGIHPAETGFKDFTRVFERDRPQLTVSGLLGNKNTYSDEMVLSGIYKKISYSLGQFHFESDGFRPSADINQNIYDAFVQIAATNKINLQFEYRNQEVKQGNQTLSLADFPPTKKENLNHETMRGGLHWTVNSQNDLIASFINSRRKESFINDKAPIQIDYISETENGNSGELQYIGRHPLGNIVIGGGIYSFDGLYSFSGKNINTSIQCRIFPDSCKDPIPRHFNPDFSGHNVYTYANLNVIDNLTGIFGLSYDTYKRNQPDADIARISPKLGLQWDLTSQIRFRATYFQSLKRLLAANQTIQPTQIAGFNQFYDDFNGTRSAFIGAGIDIRPTNDFYGGFEFNRRKLKQLDAPTGSNVELRNHIEERYRGYLFWSPFSDLVLNMEFQHEKQKGDLLNIRTNTLPLSIKYFNPSGFYSNIKTTFVWQKIIGDNKQVSFLVFDAGIGYRLPKRWGILSFEANNIFNRHFKYQDLSDISSDKFSVQRQLLPERTIFARLTINF